MSSELTDEERRSIETREWEKVVSGGGCHRKGNVRLFGDVRLLRFKLSKGPKRFLTFHPKETPLATFKLGRTAWAVVRQDGELEERQVPIASEANALVRVKLAVSRVLQAPVIFLKGLFRRRKKFSHFLLCGCNCELAYRFVRANGFLDSTFFAWASAGDCKDLVAALRRFDDIFAGEMTFDPTANDIFICSNTGTVAHSRYSPKGGGVKPERKASDIESEKAELRSRMNHLREKFRRQLRDDESTLVVVKLRPEECPEGDARIKALDAQLREMGGRNYSILAVCRKADAVHFPKEHLGYYLRTVSSYNPEWKAATEQLGDRAGWTVIWREFAPMKKLVQHKTYKFEEGH